jgi:hypothetical protein
MAMDALYGAVLETDFQNAGPMVAPAAEDARREVEAVFGTLAHAVWPQWRVKLEERSERDLEGLRRHEPEIKDEIARVLTTGRSIRRALVGSGAPVRAADLGIPEAGMTLAIRHGRKIRTRFTVLDVAAELCILDDFADRYGRDAGVE